MSNRELICFVVWPEESKPGIFFCFGVMIICCTWFFTKNDCAVANREGYKSQKVSLILINTSPVFLVLSSSSCSDWLSMSCHIPTAKNGPLAKSSPLQSRKQH